MKPRDSLGDPLSVHDIVRPADAQWPKGDVTAVLPGAEIVVKWPAGYFTKTAAKSLRRLNQHPIEPTPMSRAA